MKKANFLSVLRLIALRFLPNNTIHIRGGGNMLLFYCYFSDYGVI